MKKSFALLVAFLALSTSTAFSSARADECVTSKNPEKAFLKEVKIAISGGKLGPIKSITQTRPIDNGQDADASPEYDVLLKSGKTVHITCDDSGDDDCQCDLPSNS